MSLLWDVRLKWFNILFQSLFDKVKDSVIDILSPSWLTDMVQQINGEQSTSRQSADDQEEGNITVCKFLITLFTVNIRTS